MLHEFIFHILIFSYDFCFFFLSYFFIFYFFLSFLFFIFLSGLRLKILIRKRLNEVRDKEHIINQALAFPFPFFKQIEMFAQYGKQIHHIQHMSRSIYGTICYILQYIMLLLNNANSKLNVAYLFNIRH